MEIYKWTNLLARAETLNPVEEEAYRLMAQQPGLARPMLDTFARTTRPSRSSRTPSARAVDSRART